MKYAKGRRAVAECQRSGQKMPYRDLVEDGHIPGLLVHPDWYEPQHPQEIPVNVTDPVALYRPAPDISVPGGYGDAENLDGGTTPTTTSAPVASTLAVALSSGDLQLVTDEAITYPFGEWVFIELDAGGFFVSRITTGSTFPTFVVPFTTAITGAASIGNDVHIGES